jgi:hypothetical protein
MGLMRRTAAGLFCGPGKGCGEAAALLLKIINSMKESVQPGLLPF